MQLKKIAKIAGWILSIACLLFFVRHVSRVGLSVPGHAALATLAFVVMGAMVYAVGVLLLALAWRRMLHLDTGQTGSWNLVSSYLIGQFAKYLPGNIFHYAARHGLGVAAGASHTGLIGAAFAEIYLLLCCGSAVAIGAGAPTLAAIAPGLPAIPWPACLAPLAAAFAVSAPGRFLPALRWLPRLPFATVALVCGLYIAFFAIFGTLYGLCLTWTTGTLISFMPVSGSAAVAWVAGFVIPGPPAGAGVREVALTLGAGRSLLAPAVAGAIVLFRLITLGGDFIAFLSGGIIRARRPFSPTEKLKTGKDVV